MKRFSHFSNNSFKPSCVEGFYSGQGHFILGCKLNPDITVHQVRAAYVQLVYTYPSLLTAYCHAQDGISYIQNFTPVETAQLIERSCENLESYDELHRILPPEERALPLRIFLIKHHLYMTFSHELFNGVKASRMRSLLLALLGCGMEIADAKAMISTRTSKVQVQKHDRLVHAFRTMKHVISLGLRRWSQSKQFVCQEPLLIIKDLIYRSTFHSVDAERFYASAQSASLSPSDYFVRSLTSAYFELTGVRRFSFVIVTDLHKMESSLTVETPGNFSGGVPLSILRHEGQNFKMNHRLLLAVTSSFYSVLNLLSRSSKKQKKRQSEDLMPPPQDVRKPPFPFISGSGDFLPLVSFLNGPSSGEDLELIIQNTGPFPVLVITMTEDTLGVAIGMNSTRFGEEEQFMNNLVRKCLGTFGPISTKTWEFSSRKS
jgi:hypothetical protein